MAELVAIVTDERITALEAEVLALRRLIEHVAFGRPTTMGMAGKMVPSDSMGNPFTFVSAEEYDKLLGRSR